MLVDLASAIRSSGDSVGGVGVTPGAGGTAVNGLVDGTGGALEEGGMGGGV